MSAFAFAPLTPVFAKHEDHGTVAGISLKNLTAAAASTLTVAAEGAPAKGTHTKDPDATDHASSTPPAQPTSTQAAPTSTPTTPTPTTTSTPPAPAASSAPATYTPPQPVIAPVAPTAASGHVIQSSSAKQTVSFSTKSKSTLAMTSTSGTASTTATSTSAVAALLGSGSSGTAAATGNVYDISQRFSPDLTRLLLEAALVVGAVGFVLAGERGLRTTFARVWG